MSTSTSILMTDKLIGPISKQGKTIGGILISVSISSHIDGTFKDGIGGISGIVILKPSAGAGSS